MKAILQDRIVKAINRAIKNREIDVNIDQTKLIGAIYGSFGSSGYKAKQVLNQLTYSELYEVVVHRATELRNWEAVQSRTRPNKSAFEQVRTINKSFNEQEARRKLIAEQAEWRKMWQKMSDIGRELGCIDDEGNII